MSALQIETGLNLPEQHSTLHKQFLFDSHIDKTTHFRSISSHYTLELPLQTDKRSLGRPAGVKRLQWEFLALKVS